MADVFEQDRCLQIQGFRSITPLNIPMDTSSPIAFLQSSQEEWLDVDELSPSIPDVCLRDVETMVLLGTVHQPRPQHTGDGEFIENNTTSKCKNTEVF